MCLINRKDFCKENKELLATLAVKNQPQHLLYSKASCYSKTFINFPSKSKAEVSIISTSQKVPGSKYFSD